MMGGHGDVGWLQNFQTVVIVLTPKAIVNYTCRGFSDQERDIRTSKTLTVEHYTFVMF